LQRNSWKAKKLNSRATEQASLLTVALQRSFLVSPALMCFCDSFVFFYVAGKVYKAANFVSVQLIEQEPGIHDKYHPDYATLDKIDLAWERISREMKVSGSWLSSFGTM
jgi:hypothetical protein